MQAEFWFCSFRKETGNPPNKLQIARSVHFVPLIREKAHKIVRNWIFAARNWSVEQVRMTGEQSEAHRICTCAWPLSLQPPRRRPTPYLWDKESADEGWRRKNLGGQQWHRPALGIEVGESMGIEEITANYSLHSIILRTLGLHSQNTGFTLYFNFLK
jgi:hypothetical protein